MHLEQLLDIYDPQSKKLSIVDPILLDQLPSKPMSNASFNLAMLDKYPNWYEHLPAVEDMMRQEAIRYDKREEAGWEMGEEGEWYAPDGTPEWEWEGDLPEDLS